MEIDSGNKQETEINTRISKYTRNFHAMYPLPKRKRLPRDIKITIYQTILKLNLLHGSENGH